MGSNACYSCGKLGQNDEGLSKQQRSIKGKGKTQPNSPSEEALRRHRFFALKPKGVGEGTSGDISGVQP